MKKYISFLTFFLVTIGLSAQHRYMVFFKDKGAVSSINIEDVLSPRAIKNHQKNKVVFNALDFPVNSNYITEMNGYGSVVKVSKWLNAVIMNSNESIAVIRALDFVKEVEQLVVEKKTTDNKFQEENIKQLKTLNYDSTLQQNTQIGVDCIHDKGFLGENVLLAVIDAGFIKMDSIAAFDSLFLQSRIIDTYDFIDNDTNVFEKSTHGTLVSSVIAGNQTNYIGSAPHVDLCLYLTEDASQEVREEEFDLVRGLERADSIGADLVNISLGYLKFDTLQGDYTYADMDGQTTISAKGVQIAASKGLLIVTSAGNKGPDHIGTPCDADSILCVGATDTSNNVASFSSVGPAFDGRIKPDVSAIGEDAMCVFTDGRIDRCNGTSFSSPLTCGMVACLMQAHPLHSMLDIIRSVQQSAHQFNSPDSLLGYGIPNACVADSILNLIQVGVNVQNNEEAYFNLYPNPTNGLVTITSKSVIEEVTFYTVTGRLVKQPTIPKGNSMLINCNELDKGVYLVRVNNTQYRRLVVQ